METSDNKIERRAVLRTLSIGAAAAGAAVVGAPGFARPARADDGDPLILGQENDADDVTVLNSGAYPSTLFVYNNGTGEAVHGLAAGEIGVHGSSGGSYGVYGATTKAGFAGVYGVGGNGSAGVKARSNSGDAIDAEASEANKAAVRARALETASAVIGSADGGYGVDGKSNTNHGVVGRASAAGRAAVRGIASTDAAGVEGTASVGPGVKGTSSGSVGGVFTGSTAAVRLVPQAAAGAPASGFHQRGELLMDGTGKLFVCTADGAPGKWKKVKLSKA